MKNQIFTTRFSMNYLFVFITISFLLSYSNPCYAQKGNAVETYKTFIKQADKAFVAADYIMAKEFYQKANKIEPEYNYPINRIEEIDKILEAKAGPDAQTSPKNMNTNSNYKSLLGQADYAYDNHDYGAALLLYEKADIIKPDYYYASGKIIEIKKMLNAAPETKTRLLENTMHKADSLYEKKNYQQAKPEYEKAVLIDTSAQTPKDKLNQISSVYVDPADTSNFNLAIANGDKALASANYDRAAFYYDAALQIHPNAKFVTKKITDTKKQQTAYNEKTAQSAIAAADKLIQPEIPGKETKPKEKSDEDKKQETIIQQEQQKYDATLATAENSLKSADYQAAIVGFKSASAIKPSEKYPQIRITEIEKLIAAKASQKELDKNYAAAIANGDQLLSGSKYSDALNSYKQAISIKPNETYPADKVAEINSILAKQKSDTDNYALAIKEGEKALATGNYSLALTSFQYATKIKPSEIYPKEQLAKINAQIAAQQQENEKFNNAIKKGDQLFADKEYNSSLTSYTEAANIKKTEKYPKDQIVKINKIIADLRTIEDNYKIAITEGDKLFAANDYSAAKSTFTKASSIKPSEKYPQIKITEIEKLISAKASQTELDKNYAAAIANGDQFLSGSKYPEALNSYKQALSIKPKETYPANKVSEINSILAKQKSDADNYALAIKEGEKALATGNYSLALTSFQDAAKIKPSEIYPKEQLAKINAQIAAQQQENDRFNNALKKGDQLFADKEYSNALTAYSEAANLKRNEKYPQDQIVKINKIITDSRTIDDNYKLAIAEGDKLFTAKNYSAAITLYSKASALKPVETYPPLRITEINKIIEEAKLAHSSEYKAALEVADNLFNTKVFDKAIDAYEAAANINPGDAYPQIQINKIRRYMSDHAILDLNSQAVIISKGNEKKFTFPPIEPSLRKNDYILLKARSTSNILPKVYLNYGKDDSKNGGIVLRNLDRDGLSDLLISISIQDKWFREDNNWISISVESGEIEITRVQISAGE